MQIKALITSLLALLAAAVRANEPDKRISVRKCCGASQMLSKDGSSCVESKGPRGTIRRKGSDQILPPLDEEWVRRWLPPGLPLQSISEVALKRRILLPPDRIAVRVNVSFLWDQQQLPDDVAWKTQVVFFDDRSVARPKPGGGFRKAFYCVDAALSPLGPFALLLTTECAVEECVKKCCEKGQVLVNKEGNWQCEADAQGYWSPFNSSFANDIDAEFPYVINFFECPHLRLGAAEDRAAPWTRSFERSLAFSTWWPCFDYHRPNRTLEEGLFYCEYQRVAKGVYWLLRPLCVVSTLLLAASLVSIACDKTMRQKVHGWCLTSHAICLFGFNVGQVVYYLTISDSIDSQLFYNVSPRLQMICRHLALWMYFLLTAAWCWLTALCWNMSRGFRLQIAPTKRKERKKYLIFSAFAWGVPALLTITCSLVFSPPRDLENQEDVKWYNPSLMETRVCYTEPIVYFTSGLDFFKSGTALFYCGPVGCLVFINVIFIARTSRKVQYLRRGNSVLRRHEDQVAIRQRHAQGNISADANIEAGNKRATESKNRSGIRSAVDTKTIKLYVKMILMTGGLELFVEILCWVTTNLRGSSYEYFEFDFPYRASGYITDLFRATCTAWLAAPDGGYLGPILNRLRRQKK